MQQLVLPCGFAAKDGFYPLNAHTSSRSLSAAARAA
jgi:hypothetical protein